MSEALRLEVAPKPDRDARENELLDQGILLGRHYTFECYAGSHGNVGAPLGSFSLPTPLEYSEAKSVVDGLRPGDVLFTEGDGWTDPFPEPKDIMEAIAREPLDGTRRTERERASYRLAKLAIAYNNLERAREERTISAWGYANGLALFQGNRVMIADCTAAEMQTLHDSLRTVPSETERKKAIDAAREQKAVATMIDLALSELPDDTQSIPSPEERRRLVLLFGLCHYGGIGKEFCDRKVLVNMNALQVTSLIDRQ